MKKGLEKAAEKLLATFGRGDLENTDLKFDLYKPRPGHPDWDAAMARADKLVEEASGVIEFDTREPAEMVAEVKRIASSLGTFAKSAVINNRRLRKGNHALLPPYFIWTMHNACNFRCVYCDNHSGTAYFDLPEVKQLSMEDNKKMLRILREDLSAVYFCGGEPTLKKELPEMAEYASSIGYFPLLINTNGSRFHKILPDPRYSRLLKNLDIVIVSLDALAPKRLAKIWGVKADLCEQVVANILALRKLQGKVRFKLMVNTVITPETVDEADAILDWANDLGIWYSPVPMNCGPVVSEELTNDPAYQALCDKLIDRKKQGYKILGSKKLIEGLVRGRDIKCFPSLIPHVDGDGVTYWPCKGDSKIEPVKLNVLDYPSLDALYKAAEKMVSVKDIHGKGEGQCCADCNWMQNHVSDTLARGLANPISSGMLPELFEFIGLV